VAGQFGYDPLVLEIAILGTPLLHFEGQAFALPTKKCVAISSYLAMEGPTPRAKLADLFWERCAPEQARSNLRRELNRLRHTPFSGYLQTNSDSVALAEPYSLDVRTFAAQAEAKSFAAALGLYRGRLLDGLDLRDAEMFEEWLARRRQELVDAHVDVLRRQAEVLEATGDLRGALELELRMLGAQPLLEHAERRAIRLHYLLGERDLALARFKRFEVALEAELLLQPMPETLELVRRIRALEPLEDVPAAPLSHQRASRPLVGRRRELAVLERAASCARLIVGEAGIGKTRLADEFARAHPPRLWLRGSEASLGAPFAAVASGLYEALDDPTRAARLFALSGAQRREAARLVPDLDPEVQPLTLSPEARPRFLDGLSRALFAAVEPAGTLLLDDLHWFDPSSAELVLHLVRRAESFGIRVLATARAGELADNPSAFSIVSTLERDGLLERLTLEPLSEAEVDELCASVSKTRAGLGRRLHAATGGNPLFVLETLAALDQGTSAGEELPLALGVRDLVARQIERLGHEVGRVLEAASLASEGFTPTELGGASALGEEEEREAFDRALGANLLVQHGRHWGVRHDLVRRAIAEGVGPARRELIHSRIADNLIRQRGEPARIARHLELAGRRAEAIAHHRAGAIRAVGVYAHAEAVAAYRAALSCGPDDGEAFEIRSACVDLYAALDDRTAWQRELDDLEQLAARLADPSFQARAAVARAKLDTALGRYGAAFEAMERVVSQHESAPVLVAQALYAGGRALTQLGHVDRAEAWFRRALDASPPSGLVAELFLSLYGCAIERNQLADARRFNEEATRAFARASDRIGLARTAANEAVVARRERDYERAISRYEHAYREAEQMGLLSLQRSTVMGIVGALYDAGQIDRSLEWVELGLGLAREPQDPLILARTHHQLCALTWVSGELARSVDGSERAMEIADQIGAGQWRILFRCGLIHSLAEIGAHERGFAVANEAIALAREYGLPRHAAIADVHLAHCELSSGAHQVACERLERVLAEREQLGAVDQEHAMALVADAWLQRGDPARALGALGDRELHIVHRARQLAVVLSAKRTLGLDFERELVAARTLFAHPHLPPVESLALSRSMVTAERASHRPSEALRSFDRARSTARRLAESLASRPELQGRFVGKNRDLLDAEG
jgi:DNA-binding SARP family transcriptional activator/tetratricopeptide (TPR) repeat protein